MPTPDYITLDADPGDIVSDSSPQFVEVESDPKIIEVLPDPQFIVIDNETTIMSEMGQGAPGPAGTTNPQQFTATFAANTVIDWNQGDIAVLTLTGNTVISMLGTRKKCMLLLIQGAGGNHLATFDASVAFGSDIPSVTLSTAAGKVDYIGLAYNTVSSKFNLVGFSRGF